MKLRKFTSVIFFLATFVALGSCDKTSTSPSQTETVSSPLMYFVGSGDLTSASPMGHIFRYDVGKRLIDSFPVPEIIPIKGAALEVMPDGTKLFYSDIPDGTAKLIDLVTRQVVDTFLFPVDEMHLSPDGKWIALLNNGTIFILDTETQDIVFERRMVTAFSGSFLPDNSWFYCLMGGQGSASPLVKVFRIRTSDWLVDSILVPVIRGPSRVVVVDTAHFAFYADISVPSRETNEVAVYDLDLDSVTFRHQFSPGEGDLIFNPVLEELYFTAPGGFGDILPSGSYWVYSVSDPLDNASVDSFSVSVAVPRTPVIPAYLNLWTATNQLAVTRKMGNNIVLYSLRTRSIDTLITSTSRVRNIEFLGI